MAPRESMSSVGRIVILSICMLSASSTSWGHDLAGGALYRVRHALFGWMNRPPTIDEGLRKHLRENVLVCIGASTRQDADDYDKRYEASRNLGTGLSTTELDVLYAFLEGKLGGRDPLWSKDLDVLKSSICGSLIFESGPRPPAGLGLKLTEMVQMRSLDMDWRRECLRHLGNYYGAKWKDDSGRMSNSERKAIEECFIVLAKNKHFAADARERMTKLSKTFPEIKASMDANQIAPFIWDPAPSRSQ